MRRPRSLLIALLVTIALLPSGLGYLRWLGWMGGPLYRLLPARTAPPPAERGMAALFLSGDSGFNAGMAPHVMATLAERGLPVLGMNSLTAFSRRRTPAQARAIVVAAVRRVLALPGVSRVILVGQSFGSDMLQHGIAGLPQDLRRRVALVVLTVPGDTLLFKASPGGLLDGAPDGPALPDASRINWAPLVCIHGAEEPNSLCPLLHGANVRAVTLPGDHYLHHDAERLADVIWDAIRRRG